MNTRTLSTEAQKVIQAYEQFCLGGACVRIPYFNNKKTGSRRALPSQIGKGNPKEIEDEILLTLKKTPATLGKISPQNLTDIMVAESIGIDCSGYALYVLDAESRSRGKGSIDRHLSFPLAGNIFMRILAHIHPSTNTNVATFAHPKNSSEIKLTEVMPGDIITILNTTQSERNHILIVTNVDYQNFVPTAIYYTHSIAWPSDGTHNHGIRHGKITITDISRPLNDQQWTESHADNPELAANEKNYTHERAQQGITTLRRLNWF